VNCATISWAGGTISFAELDKASKRRDVDGELVRKFAEVQVGLWAKDKTAAPEKPEKVIIDAYKAATKPKKKLADLGTYLPRDFKTWSIPDEFRAMAFAVGLSEREFGNEAIKFHSYWTSKNRSRLCWPDWNEKWSTWLANCTKGREQSRGRGSSTSYYSFDDGVER
jgi:hypothetical protein